MTTTDDRPTITTSTCPAWCNNSSPGYPCRGEHYSSPVYIPATASRPAEVDPNSGAVYPVVGVGLVFSPLDGDEVPFITLHITGPGADGNTDLRLSEARRLLADLTAAVATLGGSD